MEADNSGGCVVIITAIGAHDRPGIIAALTQSVFEVGGNLDDATMTRLHGAFANMLSARLAGPETVSQLQSRLEMATRDLGLHVSVDVIPDSASRLQDLADHTISVYGADQAGIVYKITALLAEMGANITDLDTRMAGSTDRPVYVMLLQTSGGDWDSLPTALEAAGRDLGVDISFRELETESL